MFDKLAYNFHQSSKCKWGIQFTLKQKGKQKKCLNVEKEKKNQNKKQRKTCGNNTITQMSYPTITNYIIQKLNNYISEE